MNKIAKLMTFVLIAFGGSLWASWDQPKILGWSGTAYHDNGWLTYQMKAPYEGGALKYDSSSSFLLSPNFSEPIRKVVLKVTSKSDAPSRYLQVIPFVHGIETTNTVLVQSSEMMAREISSGDNYSVTVDFAASDGVTAFRLALSAGSKGNWAVADLVCFYGGKTEDEDAKLREFAQQLPAPENLRVFNFSESALQLTADGVGGASGYRFEVYRLTGCPATTLREDFVSAPSLSEGWTLSSTNNVKLGQYTGTSSSSYPDAKTAADGGHALQIEAGKGTDEVRVEIVSPLTEAFVAEYSFVSKRSGDADCSDAVTVFGRKVTDGEWQPLGEPFKVSTTKTWTTNSVPEELDIRQVKFVFTAERATAANCGLDTLRVVYGGNEERTSAETGECAGAIPIIGFSDLATGRYSYRAQAIGGADVRDSSWTDEQIIDLGWASLTVDAPEAVTMSASGDSLTVSWKAVPGADYYLVGVTLPDDWNGAEMEAVKTTGTSATVKVPIVGTYSVRVTAVAPGGKSTAESEEVAGEVTLGKMGEVKAEALDRNTIAASWNKIPLAERYQARLIGIGGEAETVEYGWPSDEGKFRLPAGWSHEADWDEDKDCWTSGGNPCPSLPYTGCWIATGTYPKPVTRLACQYKCGSTSANTLAVTRFAVYVWGDAGQWEAVTNLETTSSLQSLELSFDVVRNVRKLKFTAESTSGREPGKVSLGTLKITYGAEVRTDVESVSLSEDSVTFRNLDAAGRYQVVVVPQPSDGDGLASASPVINLATEKFRRVGAIPVTGLRHGTYTEDFASLTNVVGDTETRKVDLDYWQLFKGSGEAEKVLYTSGSSRTTGGVYVFSDSDSTSDSFAIGTLATGSFGCSVGLAFKNDATFPIGMKQLSFDWIQRTFKANANTNVLEYLVTDGFTGIGTEGTWTTLASLVPQLAGAAESMSESRRSVQVTEGLPTDIRPGQVLILRWRHDKGASGPMIAIDNVLLSFPDLGKGFGVIVR